MKFFLTSLFSGNTPCGLVNLVTPTAAVVMGALALGRIPYEKWLKFVWKLLLLFLALTVLLLIAAALF